MTIILNLINFNNENFKNKKSKSKMKDFIKKNLNNFYDLKNEIIKKYLNQIDNTHLELILKKNNNEYYLTLVKETYEEKYKKELKDKLRNKIKMTKDNNHKMILEPKNNNFSYEINFLYYKLKNKYDHYIPTPFELLNKKEKYVDLLFQNIISICEKCNLDNKSDLYNIIDSNDYLNYIQKVCNVNYKDYISDLFRKINELSDDKSNTPKIIASEVDNKIDINDLTENIQNMLIDDDIVDDISIKSDENNLDIDMLSDDMSLISEENVN
jgi:hypothetical protein